MENLELHFKILIKIKIIVVLTKICLNNRINNIHKVITQNIERLLLLVLYLVDLN